MSLKTDLETEVTNIFYEQWTVRDGYVVPDNNSIKLSNDGVKIDATVLYTDLADSTALVDSKIHEFSAEIYKCFLRCACKIISSQGGQITSFDGDRVMGVFLGETKNATAVKSAMMISWAVSQIIEPSLKSVYKLTDFKLMHGTGIDTGNLLVARTGIRGSNDLVWVGSAANYAAKLSGLREASYKTWITPAVFNSIDATVKYHQGSILMWEPRIWSKYNRTVYRTSYHWSF